MIWGLITGILMPTALSSVNLFKEVAKRQYKTKISNGGCSDINGDGSPDCGYGRGWGGNTVLPGNIAMVSSPGRRFKRVLSMMIMPGLWPG